MPNTKQRLNQCIMYYILKNVDKGPEKGNKSFTLIPPILFEFKKCAVGCARCWRHKENKLVLEI